MLVKEFKDFCKSLESKINLTDLERKILTLNKFDDLVQEEGLKQTVDNPLNYPLFTELPNIILDLSDKFNDPKFAYDLHKLFEKIAQIAKEIRNLNQWNGSVIDYDDKLTMEHEQLKDAIKIRIEDAINEQDAIRLNDIFNDLNIFPDKEPFEYYNEHKGEIDECIDKYTRECIIEKHKEKLYGELEQLELEYNDIRNDLLVQLNVILKGVGQYNCMYFRSFNELYNDPNEPIDKGICVMHSIYREYSIEFAIVSIAQCKRCPYRKV